MPASGYLHIQVSQIRERLVQAFGLWLGGNLSVLPTYLILSMFSYKQINGL